MKELFKYQLIFLVLLSKHCIGENVCDREGETCQSYFLCKKSKNVYSDGIIEIDEKFDEPSVAAPKCQTLKKCCTKDMTIDPENIAISSFTNSANNVCEGMFPTPIDCGKHNPKGIGGMAQSKRNKTLYAQYAEFPWVVAILRLSVSDIDHKTLKIFQSGGSLIHRKIVLTTAHNIVGLNAEKLIARAGEWDLQSENEMCKHEEREVRTIVRHEEFVRYENYNDLALLVLADEFSMTPFINTICLPPAGMKFDNQRCWTSGWGKGKFRKPGFYQGFLKKLEVSIVPRDKCQKQLRQVNWDDDDEFTLHQGFLCAGDDEGRDFCSNDGGSSLICPNPSRPQHFYLTGIVVSGGECGQKDFPGIYADVSNYRAWIDKKLINVFLNS